MDKQTEIEAAVLRRFLKHLDDNKSVQNIDLMNLAGFCRNCLSKWYLAEAEDRGVDIDYDAAREYVYGEPYNDWKEKYQPAATAEQLADFNAKFSK
ncbi:hypothetical protein MSP8887_01999 [Marinomonas spartinae]|uniref:SMc04008-like domain-containing protein n=1 Tax=Marinomonas spartinae TaxID=1792290 RepID=A0A1A8TG62_9GAMM|nr:DUF1244 domain-containing protein [Marinomonas spartinae]SBS31562.1 hypothetical protein MSP8886_02163 [Marinomonas spartinae]SBS33732.1 hypothetical protein MSP8887_01999 [Marinomonas spartinae]